MFAPFLQNLRKMDEETGLSPFQQFAAALDPLILPEMRAGNVIRAQGASNLANKRRNATIAELTKRADAGDAIAARYLSGVQTGALDMKSAYAGYLNESAEEKRFQQKLAATLAKAPAPSEIEKRFNFFISQGYTKEQALEEAKKKSGGITISNKGADEFEKMDAKTLSEVYSAGSAAQRSLNQINRLGDILSRIETGGSANLQAILGDFGIQSEGLDDIQAARALINQLVPQQRPAGSGPMSDADLELFKQSLPRIINSPNGNQIILQTMRGIAEYDRQGAEIVQRFRAGEIDKITAFQLLQSRADPFASNGTEEDYFPNG